MNRALIAVLLEVIVLFTCWVHGHVLMTSHDTNSDYPDYQLGVKYDEYPMIVPKKKTFTPTIPKKRTAMLVDRLMVALQHALDDEEAANKIDPFNQDKVRKMDLQRRGHGSLVGQQKGRVWRCYFNAVTCF